MQDLQLITITPGSAGRPYGFWCSLQEVSKTTDMPSTRTRADKLAIEAEVPSARHCYHTVDKSIDDEDVQAVTDTLRSAWLTTGPKVDEFEEAFAFVVGAKYAISFAFSFDSRSGQRVLARAPRIQTK